MFHPFRRQLDRMMENEDFLGATMNQQMYQDVYSHLSQNAGDETSNDCQTLGVTFDQSQNVVPDHVTQLSKK